MATEDFTTYTEVDPNNKLSQTATRASFAVLRRNESAYLYKDKAADYFNGDFEHLLTVYFDAGSYNGGAGYGWVWSLQNSIEDIKALKDGGRSGLHCRFGYWTTHILNIGEYDSGSGYGESYNCSLDTPYYLKIKRDESVGDYGTLYCYIYSDSARTDLLETLSLELHSSKKDFRYIYATNSFNDGQAAPYVTGYCENLDLQEAGLQTISPSAIASAEFFGTPAILPGVAIISPSAIASLEAFGTPAILPGVVIISPSAIASAESFGTPSLVYGQTISPSAIASLEAFGEPVVILVTRYDQWTYWNVDAYAVALCSYGSAVFAFRIDATDGHLYRCESSDNAESWGSWIDMGDVSGVSGTRLAACFKDADEAIVIYSIGGTLYRRRWNGSTWEAAAAWSNSLSSITGIAVTYMGDWNVVITGVDGNGRAGVWTCVLGNGYSAAVDSWSALKDVMIAEAGAGISFSYPSVSMPDVFRMFFVETYSGSESYSRPYWSHSLATADFISNLWREPIPFNLDSDHGLALCYKSPYAWLSRPARVWRASLTPPFVELTDSLLSVSSRIIPYRGGIEITLRNDDRRFNSLGSGTYEAIKKASEILISWGYHTTEGKETGGFDPTTWIESWEYVTRGGQSQFILHSEDGWSILKRWRARRQFTWSQGSKNIYQLLALIFARAGLELSAFSTSTALVNQYPAFTINPGESGLTAVKRLLSMVPDVIFFVRDTAYLKNPQASDSSQYSYGTDHRILEASFLDRSATFNRVQVFGDGVFTEDWDWDEIALVYDRLIHVSDVNLDTTTKAHQRGQAIIDALGHDVSSAYWEYWESEVWPELAHQLGIATLREFEIEGLNGIILVPMNCGQDLFDVISITSPQAGLNASKRRVISLTRSWTPNKPKSRYQMRVGLGAP